MAAKRYSAGAIFLQVVPVFADVQREIEREAKKIDNSLGDSMEQSGKKAGKRAGKAASEQMNAEIEKGSRDAGETFQKNFRKNIGEIEKSLGNLNINRFSNDTRKELASLKKEFASFKDLDLTADVNFSKAHAAIKRLKDATEGLRDDVRFSARADIDNALASIKRIETEKAKLEKPVTVEVEADTTSAERSLGKFEQNLKKRMKSAAAAIGSSVNPELKRLKERLDDLHDARIGVDVSAEQARAELAAIERDALRVAKTNPTIQVKTDALGAAAQLRAARMEATALGRKTIDVKVKSNTSHLNGMEKILHSIGLRGESAANSFRSFNGVLLAAVSIGPALLPILSAIAGGLTALGPAAGVAIASISTLLVGFSGVGDGLQALSQQSDAVVRGDQTRAKQLKSASYQIQDAKRALADAERNAGREAEDAARRVADAREQAADAIENALDRQREAQESYRDSVESVADAEQALRDARKEASRDREDLSLQIRENELALQEGLINEFNAKVRMNAVNADGSATNTEKDQARIDWEQAKLQQDQLEAKQKELREEQAKFNKQGIDGSEKVKSAQDALADAIDRQRDAYRDVQKAAKEVDEARTDGARNVADALRDQNRTLADNQRAIEQAREALRRAGESYGDTASAIDTQAANVESAFGKMGKAGRDFTLFLWGLRDGFYGLRNAIQAVLLPQVQDAMEDFFDSANADAAATSMVVLADSFGRVVKLFSTSLQGSAWGGFFNMLADLGPEIQEAYGRAFISFLEALASILTVSAPFALEFAEALANLMDRFADWAASEKGREQIEGFLDFMREEGPKVAHFLGSLARAFVAIVVALQPWSDLVLTALDKFATWIDNMDPDTLGVLSVALIGLALAFQFVAAVGSLAAGLTVLTNPFGYILLAIVGITIAIAALYTQNEDFKAWVDENWPKVKKAFVDAWEAMQPSLRRMMDALNQLWHEILEPFFAWFGPIFVDFMVKYIQSLGFWWGLIIDAMAFAIKWVLIPMIKMWSIVFSSTWRAMKTTWNKAGKPLFDIIIGAFELFTGDWENFVDRMKSAWQSLPGFMKNIVKSVVNILNGMIKGFNVIAKFVGIKELKEITLPTDKKKDPYAGLTAQGKKNANRFASGGVMPGYTPGRDVHHFQSASGGSLHLSGGEAIMRPEWTAAMGTGFVNTMNALARSGGVNAVKKAMMGQAFARGGVFWPLPGGVASTYGGHDGVDLNAPNDMGKPYYAAVPGNIVYVGSGRGYGNAIFEQTKYGTLVYGHSSRTAVKVGQTVAAGQYIGNVGNTGNSTGPHLHFGFPGGTYGQAMALLTGSAKSGYIGGHVGQSLGAVPGFIKDMLAGPIDEVKSWISEPMSEFKKVYDSGIGRMLGELPSKLVKGFADKASDIIPDFAKDIASLTPIGAIAGLIGKVANGSIQKQAQEALSESGFASWAKGGQWDALKTLVQKESSWNPNAKNPTSSAAGLFQFLSATRSAYGIGLGSSVYDQVVAGAQYIKDRYGSPASALAFHNANNWYSEGGVYGEADGGEGGAMPYNGTMMYDNGGYLPPGLTTVMNLTGKPEPVFTSDQWSQMNGRGATGPGIHYEPHFEGSDLTADDVAADLNFQFKKLTRGGKYSR